jgi:hypothetical protein
LSLGTESIEQVWQDHEKMIEDFLNKREQINTKIGIFGHHQNIKPEFNTNQKIDVSLVTFEQFWEDRCRFWGEWAITCFYVGSIFFICFFSHFSIYFIFIAFIIKY